MYIYSPCVQAVPSLPAWCEMLRGADVAAPRYACDVVAFVPFRLLLCCVPPIARCVFLSSVVGPHTVLTVESVLLLFSPTQPPPPTHPSFRALVCFCIRTCIYNPRPFTSATWIHPISWSPWLPRPLITEGPSRSNRCAS